MGNNRYNPEIEDALIACVLKDGSCFSFLVDICDSNDFYWKPYSWIWQCFTFINDRGMTIDFLTTKDEMQRMGFLENFVTATEGIKGIDGLEKVRSSGAIVDNAETYALQVKDDSAKRKTLEVISLAKDNITEGNSTSIGILTNLEAELGKISAFAGAKSNLISDTKTVLKAAMEATELAAKGNRKYIETGLTALDYKIGGFFNGQLVTIAGRQGEGKSSLLLTFAVNMSLKNKWKKKVGIFSLEMSNEEYIQRMIAYLSGISSLRLKLGKIKPEEEQAYKDAIKTLQEAEIVFDDSVHLSIPLLRTKLRKMKETGVQIVLLDQLNLLDFGSPSEAEYIRVDKISYRLKKLAREIDLPIVVAQQMSRAIENSARGKDSDPKASDLSQAGESAPNIIIMIRHKKEKSEIKSSNLFIVKNRDGATGAVPIKFIGEQTMFVDVPIEELGPSGFVER